MHYDYNPGTIEHMAPERISRNIGSFWIIDGPSEASDVYSLAMTSFEVRFSVVNHPTA
jgi:serine/threonine protein kinase